MAFRGLLSKSNVRTPLFVSLAIVGTNYYASHHKRHELGDSLRPHLEFGSAFGPQFGLRRAHAKTVQEICKEKFKSIVSIRHSVRSDFNKSIECLHNTSSGFITTNGYIVTTARAVGNAKVVDVLRRDNDSSANQDGLKIHGVSRVLNVDPKLDLALLGPIEMASNPVDYTGGKNALKNTKFDRLNDGLEINTTPVKYSEDVVALGSAWDYNTVSKGIVSCPNRLGRDITKIGKQYPLLTPNVEYIQHTASFAFDDYGGALLDMDGKVVGLYFYLQLIDNIVLYYAIPAKQIQDFLNKAFAALPQNIPPIAEHLKPEKDRRSPYECVGNERAKWDSNVQRNLGDKSDPPKGAPGSKSSTSKSPAPPPNPDPYGAGPSGVKTNPFH